MLWIRVTKCAGGSLAKALPKNIARVSPTINQVPFFQNYVKENPKLKIFTLIRDPIMKYYSAYRFLTGPGVPGERCKDIVPTNISFYEFLLLVQDLRKDFLHIKNICVPETKVAFLPNSGAPRPESNPIIAQKYWVVSHMETSIDTINFFTDIKNVTFFCMENDWESEINDFLLSEGYQLHRNIRHLNRSEKRAATVDRECIKLIENLYSKDLELYNRMNRSPNK